MTSGWRNLVLLIEDGDEIEFGVSQATAATSLQDVFKELGLSGDYILKRSDTGRRVLTSALFGLPLDVKLLLKPKTASGGSANATPAAASPRAPSVRKASTPTVSLKGSLADPRYTLDQAEDSPDNLPVEQAESDVSSTAPFLEKPASLSQASSVAPSIAKVLHRPNMTDTTAAPSLDQSIGPSPTASSVTTGQTTLQTRNLTVQPPATKTSVPLNHPSQATVPSITPGEPGSKVAKIPPTKANTSVSALTPEPPVASTSALARPSTSKPSPSSASVPSHNSQKEKVIGQGVSNSASESTLARETGLKRTHSPEEDRRQFLMNQLTAKRLRTSFEEPAIPTSAKASTSQSKPKAKAQTRASKVNASMQSSLNHTASSANQALHSAVSSNTKQLASSESSVKTGRPRSSPSYIWGNGTSHKIAPFFAQEALKASTSGTANPSATLNVRPMLSKADPPSKPSSSSTSSDQRSAKRRKTGSKHAPPSNASILSTRKVRTEPVFLVDHGEETPSDPEESASEIEELAKPSIEDPVKVTRNPTRLHSASIEALLKERKIVRKSDLSYGMKCWVKWTRDTYFPVIIEREAPEEVSKDDPTLALDARPRGSVLLWFAGERKWAWSKKISESDLVQLEDGHKIDELLINRASSRWRMLERYNDALGKVDKVDFECTVWD